MLRSAAKIAGSEYAPRWRVDPERLEAFAKGDIDTVGALFHDDMRWHAPGTSALSGDYRGKAEVFGFFAKLQELTEGTFHQEIHAVLADDDHVVVLTEGTQGKPRPFTGQAVFVWPVRDGKAVECWAIQADQAAIAAALEQDPHGG